MAHRFTTVSRKYLIPKVSSAILMEHFLCDCVGGKHNVCEVVFYDTFALLRIPVKGYLFGRHIFSGFKKRAVEADFTIVYDCHMIFLIRVIMMDNPNQIP